MVHLIPNSSEKLKIGPNKSSSLRRMMGLHPDFYIWSLWAQLIWIHPYVELRAKERLNSVSCLLIYLKTELLAFKDSLTLTLSAYFDRLNGILAICWCKNSFVFCFLHKRKSFMGFFHICTLIPANYQTNWYRLTSVNKADIGQFQCVVPFSFILWTTIS